MDDCALISHIQQGACEIQQAFMTKERVQQMSSMIRWYPPPVGFVKLNTNGAARGNPRIAGARGLLRSDSGLWLLGFQANLGHCSNIVAELQAFEMRIDFIME